MKPADNFTVPNGWVATCAWLLQQLGPAIFAELAHDLAIELHNAWPQMDPAVAAAEFLFPPQTLILV